MRLIRESLSQIVGIRVANFLLRKGLALVPAAFELVLISFPIELALALPMAWYLHRTTSMSLPANMLLIPLASILMPAAVLAVGLLTGTIRMVEHFRIADVRLPVPGTGVCASAITLALVLSRRKLWLCWNRDRRITGCGAGHHLRAAEDAATPRHTGDYGNRCGRDVVSALQAHWWNAQRDYQLRPQEL